MPLGKNAPIEGTLELITEEIPTQASGPMDWTNFDFANDEAFNSANDPIAQEALDVDTFFKKLDGSVEDDDIEAGTDKEVRITKSIEKISHFLYFFTPFFILFYFIYFYSCFYPVYKIDFLMSIYSHFF